MPNQHNRYHRTVEQRFWEKVQRSGAPDACWLWIAARDRKGYGVFSRGPGNAVFAHRFAYELHHGAIPAGLSVCHNCPGGDNPSCVNPAHLWLGTQSENMRDKVAKGRQQRGERGGGAKLTAEDVRAMRQRHANGERNASLAREFGLSSGQMSRIISRQRWSHIA